MSKQLTLLVMVLGLAVHVGAEERGILVTFNGGIGVDPVSNVAAPANADGTFQNVVRNIVRGVQPGGGPWRIADLKATITTDGRIRITGRAASYCNVIFGKPAKPRKRLLVSGKFAATY